MFGRMTRSVGTLAVALLLLAIEAPAALEAQQVSRIRVLIPDFFPQQDANKNFGRDMSEDLRELVDGLAAYMAIERDDIRDVLDRLDVEMEDLNCLSTRQLGPQIQAAVAMCANYVEQDRQRVVSSIEIIDLQTGTSFPVDDITVDRDDSEVAAQHVLDAFDAYIQQARFRTFCFDYSSEQNELWDDALRTCQQALELNPDDAGVRYQLAYVRYRTDDLEGALQLVEEVLELDPFNQEALNLGGFVATTLGNQDEGREYYSRYLELNPGAVDVRRNIAYDVADAGDPVGAVEIIREGLAAGESVALLGDLANYSFLAARRLLPEGFQPSPTNPVPDDVAGFYDDAIDAYMQVFEARGDSMDVTQLRNVIVAQVQMNRLEDAASTSEMVLRSFPNEPVIWATYADALRRLGRADDAVRAYQEIEELDPNYPDLYARQGQILIQADRRDDAIPVLMRAVERGGDPNQLSRLIFADAYSRGIDPTPKRWQWAIDGILAAKEFPNLSDGSMGELNFWHGFALYNRAIEVCLCGPNASGSPTPETARRAQSMFEQVKSLLQSPTATQYSQGRNLENNRTQIIGGADSYIEIQSAIIRRGGGFE